MINKIEPLQEIYGQFEYDKSEVDNLLSSLQFETGDLTGKTVYVQCKQISQNKLREKGFSITRSRDKADIIIINDVQDLIYNGWSTYRMINRNNYVATKAQVAYIDDLYFNYTQNYKHVFIKDIYKYLYTYEGNRELYDNIYELLNSGDDANVKMSMEFMSNANWEGNEIYVMDLFSQFWKSAIRHNHYRNSISFKGFLESLGFNYDSTNFYNASDYRHVCKNDEHHNFVYDKYKDKFKQELDELISQYKIQIDKLEYSIDKSIINP